MYWKLLVRVYDLVFILGLILCTSIKNNKILESCLTIGFMRTCQCLIKRKLTSVCRGGVLSSENMSVFNQT